jgi:NADPH:quinone reductase-like Zn-dependent oxidoreductase
MGIHPIITSTSPHKLQAVRELAPPGAVGTIDSSAIPEWEVEAKKLSDGVGVDIVLDMGGPATVAQSLGALRNRGGVVSLVGFLAPFSFDRVPNVILPLLSKAATLR